MGRPARYTTTTAVPRLDVRVLARRGHLRDGCRSFQRWTCGDELTAEATATVLPDGLLLAHGGVRYLVPLEREPLHYGGTRPWFRCPAAGCGRRCGVLYLRRYFACRRCQELVYPSTRMQAHERLQRRGARLLERLGADWTLDPWAVPKPKGMRWRTYERLREEATAVETARVHAIVGGSSAWLERMRARLG